MDYEEWERSVPGTIAGDSLWKIRAYRLALFLSELGWHWEKLDDLLRDIPLPTNEI